MPAILLLLVLVVGTALGGPDIRAGYTFLEGHSHTTIHFDRHNGLIIIPVVMNDTMKLRLILDTGTRSLLLYGKKFRSLQNIRRDKQVKVTGWGSPNGVNAFLSFPNKVSLGEIRGEAVGVAIVDRNRVLPDMPGVDGIIGYELFARFAVEINYRTRTIHLYDRLPAGHTELFTALPLEVNKARPQVESEIIMSDNKSVKVKLLIDTGSSLGLVVFSSSCEKFPSSSELKPVGRGLNGNVFGYDLMIKQLMLGSTPVKNVRSHLVDVPDHPDDKFTFAGSLGGAFLRDHVVIFDYPRSTFFISSKNEG
jgi:hypothetical protein